MPRPSLDDDAMEAMRVRLATAALDLYRSEGLEAISFRRIADATGISHTLPYRYFENKEALLARMRADALARFDQVVRLHESRADGELAKVHALVDGYIAFACEHPADYLLIFSTHQPPAERYPELLAARQQVFDHAVAAAQRCIDKGVMHGDARDIAHAFWLMMHGLMTLHSADQLVHGRQLDELRSVLIDRMLIAATQAPILPTAESSQPTRPISTPAPTLKTSRRVRRAED